MWFMWMGVLMQVAVNSTSARKVATNNYLNTFLNNRYYIGDNQTNLTMKLLEPSTQYLV